MAEVQRHVAVLVPIEIGYGRLCLRGIAEYARRHGRWQFAVTGGNIAAPLGEPTDFKGDGMIFHAANPQLAMSLARLTIPRVNVSAVRSVPGVPSVVPDSEAIGKLGARYLLDRAFKRFAFCGFPGFAYSDRRGRAFASIVNEAGLSCEVFEGFDRRGDWTFQDDIGEVRQWVATLEPPLAVMAANDVRARQVIDLVNEAGLSVPDDVAVLGVDNDDIMCDFADPPLSSIIIPAETIGYEAAALLDRMIQGEPPPGEPVLIKPGHVVTRQSTDILAIDDREIAQAVHFIRHHATAGINVDDVLVAVPIARRTFERRFRKLLGRSPLEEIQRVRIEMAKALLREGNQPMPAVARRAGFRDGKHLSSTFRRVVGQSPLRYRKAHRTAADDALG